MGLKNTKRNTMARHELSKSTFIRGIKCHKALYLNKHRKDLRDEISAQQQAIFTQGTNVGELACNLFPGGVDCTPDSFYDFEAAVEKTSQEIKKGTKIIYEAAFQFNGVLAALDILVKHDDGWRAYEVKSSTGVSETYELDATIQYYAITNSGIDLKDISIVHIDNTYVLDGELDVHQFFATVSVKERVLELLPGIPNQVAALKKVLKQDEVPEVEIGPHCNSPYGCDFAGHCWKHVPEYSVFDIKYARGLDWELYKQGILKTTDIPDDYKLNERHAIQINGDKNGTSIINKKAINSFLSRIKYPIAHIDFETYMTAVPEYQGNRPYQFMCFQWSAHIQKSKDGEIVHKEYLAKEGTEPQEQFLITLIEACKDGKTILVYNKGFEGGRLNSLAEQFPKYASDIASVLSKFVDLMEPFQQKDYYLSSMRGSYSIKNVLPALVPSLSYKTLNIQEGGTASATFAALKHEKDADVVSQTRKDLLAYCEMDTWAMVKLLEELYI